MINERGSGRLLEMLAEHIDAWRWMSDDEHNGFTEMRAIVIELRRRGDALVWACDLEFVIQALGRERIALSNDDARALDRLDGALRGVL